MRTFPIPFVLLLVGALASAQADERQLRIGTFDVDASPPVGSLMAYDPVQGCKRHSVVGA
ncbi:MAG: hypothetical protein R3C12_24710 [Planctomycetaceae bacterium]